MQFHKILFAGLLTAGLAGTAMAADSMSGPAKPATTNGMSGPAMGNSMSGPKTDAMAHPMMKKKVKKKTMAKHTPMGGGMSEPSDGMAGPKAP